MPGEDARRPGAERLCGSDIVAGFQAAHFGAHQPRRRGPDQRRDDQHEQRRRWPHQPGDDQHQRQRRNRQHDIGKAHQQPVGPATEIAGERPDQRAKAGGEQRPDQPDRQRDATAMQQPGQHITAQFIGAEPVRRRWWQRPAKQRQRLLVVAIGGQHRPEHTGGANAGEQAEPDGDAPISHVGSADRAAPGQHRLQCWPG